MTVETLDEIDNDIDATEERRLARRAEIKRELTEITVRLAKIDELRAFLGKLDERVDEAAERHRAATEPLQAETESLDDEFRQLVLADKPTPPKSVKRRREIIEQLSDANAALEDAVEQAKKARQPIAKQIHVLETQCSKRIALKNELCRFATGEQLDREHILKSRTASAEGRLRHARGYAEQHRGLITEAIERGPGYADQRAHYTERLRRWELIVSDASQEIAELHRQSDELRREMAEAD